jgi:hypothetical protein
MAIGPVGRVRGVSSTTRHGARPAAQAGATRPGLELVPLRPRLVHGLEIALPLRVGDRPLVEPGESVLPGVVVAEHLRDTRLVEEPLDGAPRPGERWSSEPVPPDGEPLRGAEGELLFEAGGRWRIAAGEHREPLESPIAGIVREVRPGQAIRLQARGAVIPATVTLGGGARGRLEIATDADGEVMPRALDVGSAGAILVVGARIDAEALTRARAMGVRGIVVATLPSKDRRDFLASEARQRAALHRLPPYGVLVLHGVSRRPIASPLMRLFEVLAGREVAIVVNPPGLVVDLEGVRLPTESPDEVHVRSGPMTGRSGRWAGLAGLRRFAGGTHLEAGLVRIGEGAPVAIPLGDLERFA